MENEPQILIPISKFKEILIYAWHLIPPNKQQELIAIGIYPKK